MWSSSGFMYRSGMKKTYFQGKWLLPIMNTRPTDHGAGLSEKYSSHKSASLMSHHSKDAKMHVIVQPSYE